jgi:hypothetical protein
MTELSDEKTRRAGRERRRSHRRNVVDRQMVTVELGGGRTGILIDLSESGMAVQPFLPIAAGTELDFHFDLPRGAGRISGKGTVNSATRTGRVGIEFLHLTERSLSHLQAWLKVTRDPFTVPEAASTPWPSLPAGKPLKTGLAESDELDQSTALAMIADRARSITRSDGAVIIIASSTGFICCASSGRAPAKGTPAAADASLTGECLRLGLTVLCNDTSTDARVNPMACEHFNLRAVLVVPLIVDSRTIGALEVLSPVADSFTERDVARVEQLADIASGILLGDVCQAQSRET